MCLVYIYNYHIIRISYMFYSKEGSNFGKDEMRWTGMQQRKKYSTTTWVQAELKQPRACLIGLETSKRPGNLTSP